MTFSRTSKCLLATAALLGTALPATATAKPAAPEISVLTTFGTGLGSGSTIGPDGALYVTDGNAGSVVRIDRRTGAKSTFADGLPIQIVGLGGAMDVAFVGDMAYVLVTVVGFGGPGEPTVGIYRLGTDGNFAVVADIGTWSIEHPPTTDFFVPTGVQYSIETFRGAFVVTDGHHNRVLHVTRDGQITEMVTFGNIVPTGLETSGNTIFMGQAGPTPHEPEDGKVVSFGPRAAVSDVAAGASMIVDVEMGRGHQLYALSQGTWNGVGAGSPALENTGRLMMIGDDGTMTPVVDDRGEEIVLDRPTSLEFRGTTAYVVSLTGTVYKIANI